METSYSWDSRGTPEPAPETSQWDGFTIWDFAVLYEGGVFKMWYGAAAAFPGESRVGYATSPNGSDWTKDPSNPLPSLAPGSPGEWDDQGVSPSTVLYDGVEYRIWFVARQDGPDWGTWRLGTATSPDGITWTRHPAPVLVGSLPWEGDLLYLPEVISYGGGYAMWYTAYAWEEESEIGYAVSPDGIHWGRWPDNPVLSPLPGCGAANSFAAIIEGDTVHGWMANCYNVWHLTSQLEVVFFDALETRDCAIWSSMVP